MNVSPSTCLPLPVNNYESFHSIYDLPEYASIFGQFATAAYDGSALIYFSSNQSAISGPGASFGGVLFKPSYVNTPKLNALKETIDGLANEIKKQSPTCTSIFIRLAPDIYYPADFIQALRAAFAVAGWSNVGEVTHVVSRDSFKPRDSTLRNARKAKDGTVVRRINPDICFDFLSTVKSQKGYEFNYKRVRFLEQFAKFPDLFRCLGVQTARGELIAGSFELATDDWALLLNWDQSTEGKSMGATNYLLLERLEELFRAGCRFVDMGTTTYDGWKANWGLIRHKENFGAHAILRNTYLFRFHGQNS